MHAPCMTYALLVARGLDLVFHLIDNSLLSHVLSLLKCVLGIRSEISGTTSEPDHIAERQ